MSVKISSASGMSMSSLVSLSLFSKKFISAWLNDNSHKQFSYLTKLVESITNLNLEQTAEDWQVKKNKFINQTLEKKSNI